VPAATAGIARLGDNLADVSYDFGGFAEAIMISNGLYSLIAVAIDGVDVEVGGVLILRDGQIHGGDSFVFYTGTYDSSDGKWKGEMISQEHTPTTRPVAKRVQHTGSAGPTTTPVSRPMPQPTGRINTPPGRKKGV
jgi:hypothetical protein